MIFFTAVRVHFLVQNIPTIWHPISTWPRRQHALFHAYISYFHSNQFFPPLLCSRFTVAVPLGCPAYSYLGLLHLLSPLPQTLYRSSFTRLIHFTSKSLIKHHIPKCFCKHPVTHPLYTHTYTNLSICHLNMLLSS